MVQISLKSNFVLLVFFVYLLSSLGAWGLPQSFLNTKPCPSPETERQEDMEGNLTETRRFVQKMIELTTWRSSPNRPIAGPII